jgi:hypothetical protein
MLIELLRSLQLSRKKREGGLYWPGPQQLPVYTPQITMEIYISDWIHKFQNKTGLDAKAILELYKSKRVCSVAITCLQTSHIKPEDEGPYKTAKYKR